MKQHPQQTTPPQPPLRLGSAVFLLLLCVIFYAALYYFTQGMAALQTQQGLTLAVVFCVGFSVYLGFNGWRVTQRLWVAPLLHTALAAGLLGWDIPLQMLLHNADVTATLLGSVFVCTGIGSVYGRLRGCGQR